MFVKAAFEGELELNFFAQQEFESIQGILPKEQAPIITRNVLRFLMMGWKDSWTQFITPAVIQPDSIKG